MFGYIYIYACVCVCVCVCLFQAVLVKIWRMKGGNNFKMRKRMLRVISLTLKCDKLYQVKTAGDKL